MAREPVDLHRCRHKIRPLGAYSGTTNQGKRHRKPLANPRNLAWLLRWSWPDRYHWQILFQQADRCRARLLNCARNRDLLTGWTGFQGNEEDRSLLSAHQGTNIQARHSARLEFCQQVGRNNGGSRTYKVISLSFCLEKPEEKFVIGGIWNRYWTSPTLR